MTYTFSFAERRKKGALLKSAEPALEKKIETGDVRANLPTYTIEQVAEHTTK